MRKTYTKNMFSGIRPEVVSMFPRHTKNVLATVTADRDTYAANYGQEWRPRVDAAAAIYTKDGTRYELEESDYDSDESIVWSGGVGL